ncbi:ABC transporter permease subunit [Haloferax namakaokahaiae]|uniref:ABC transporter permease subunit n=1 Tax=Haloferax namakaokahaiae TaxID=1748331 RepID=A0ABD5ZG21_9EURY
MDDLFAVAARELQTMARMPAMVALSGVFTLTIVAVAAAGSGARGGFVPLVLDLLPFVELLLPLLAFALCYRVVLADRNRGEIDVLRTFGVSRLAYVGGVYLGRGLTLVTVVGTSLVAAGAAVLVLSPPESAFLAVNTAADSPLAFVRFGVLSVLFALTTAAIALAISAAARTTRQALAFAVGLLVVFAVGVDAAAVAGVLSGTFGLETVPAVVALSPNGAFRTLVFSLAVESGSSPSPLLALVGLFAWLFGSVGVAVATAWDR